MKANKKKDTILKMLKENSDRYISGEELSEMFNVSRTAIWKNINDLRKMGYDIDSVTNRGYKLMSSPGILNAGETKTYIDDNALIGKELIVFETIDSTNTYLKSNAEKYPTGTVIASREQTGGKGRLGRVWQSKKDDTKPAEKPDKKTVKAKKVVVNKKRIVLKKGKKVKLKVKLKPANATEKVTFKSSNKKVAKVTKNGVVKAVKKGKCKITVKTASGKKAVVKVTVK